MTDISKHLRNLTPQQRALLELRLKNKRASTPPESTPASGVIARRADVSEAPLSYAQERLWFLEKLEPGRAAYNVPGAYRIEGALDPTALASAIDAIVSRHEVLRARVVEDAGDGEPRLAISAPTPAALPCIDLGHLDAASRRTEATRLARAEAGRPFALDRGALFRASLLRLGEEEHVLLVTFHHIVSDGWSLGIFVRELNDLYESRRRGRPPSVPELAVQYGDYALWQREWLTGDRLERQLAYWREQLKGAPVLELPTDAPRSTGPDYRSGRVPVALGRDLSAALEKLAESESSTLFMVLLAGLQALFYRYTGEPDVVIGSVVANRRRSELEGLLGLFANTLVLRTDLHGDPTFAELLERVRAVALGAYENQDVPLEKLVEELAPERKLSGNPFFEVAFAFQNLPGAAAPRRDVAVRPIEGAAGRSRFELTFELAKGAEGIIGAVTFRSDLFRSERIEAMTRHLVSLLGAACEAPERRLSELPLFPESERDRLIAVENDTARAYPACSIHARFEDIVREHPDAPALVLDDGTSSTSSSLSYRELDRRANRFARHLAALGLGLEGKVGVCLHRSVDLVVALVGISKAGGVYVPLDPSYPEGRLGFMIEDAGVTAIVTETSAVSALPETAVPMIRLDDDGERASIAARGDDPLDVAVDPDGLAYITYTSGSTGRPKGVEVRHRGVVRLVSDVGYVRLGPGETHLFLAPIAFDASTFEIWGALLNGGRLALYPEGVPTAEELGAVLDRHEVTTLWLTASLFNAVVDEAPSVLRSVRQLLVGGEALSVPHVERARRELPETVVINGYGPTEGTTFTCSYRVPRERVADADSIPIGVPIANTTVYLLDAHLEPVPEGFPGELFIGGDGLARGYRNDPERTAIAFVPDPFSQRPGARLYRTGDLARRRSDGNIDFLGRRDQQVKLRGFRIELGEIAATLESHEAVARAVVLVTEGGAGAGADADTGTGTRRLVAFIVPREGTPSAAPGTSPAMLAAVRRFLLGKLPEYMIPSEIAAVDSLPLTANGKLDREALLRSLSGMEAADEVVPPRGPTEEALAAIWRDILGCDRVGAKDDFFRRGGQSLAAARMVTRLRKVFGVDLPLRSVFETPTLEAIAALIDTHRAAGRRGRDPLDEITTLEAKDEAAPLSLSQRRLWLLDQLGMGGASYNVTGAVRLRGPLDREALVSSLAAIVERHETLRTTIAADGSGQRVHPPGVFSVARLDLDAAALERFLGDEAARPFDLEAGPLFRCHLITLGPEDHVLVWNVHHIVADGWSVGVLFRELRDRYRAALAGGGDEALMSPLRVQYRDYARWQRGRLDAGRLEEDLRFWRDHLRGAPPAVELPLDRRRRSDRPAQGARVARALPEGLAEAARDLSRDLGSTLFATLFAAFYALVHRLTGAFDLVLGTPVANRNRAELEGLIGFFVNTLAVRCSLSGAPSFRDLVGDVRDSVLGAFDHMDVPFEKLVEELRPERSSEANPFFQAVFAFQNASQSQLTLEGLDVTAVPFELRSLRFDVEFHLWEQPSGLFAVVSYNADLYHRETVEAWLGYFATLLDGACREPDRPVSELGLVGEPELRALERWNATARRYPDDVTIAQQFELAVAGREDSPALVLGDAALDYAELNGRANRLAHYLRELGVGPEVRVGVEGNRSIDTVVTLLAIAKAGGAYVPIDPGYPPERVRLLLADASVAVLVTPGGSGKLVFPCPAGVAHVDLERDRAAVAAASADNPRALASPDNIAYVMYTSGSTGRPKGVSVPHRAVLRLLFGVDYVSLGDDARVLQLAPLSFDASTFEIWGALLHGGTLVLHPERVPSAEGLEETLRRQRVSTLWLTSSLFNALVDESPALFESTRELLVGGEALSLPHIRRAQESCPRTRFINGYGPTEGTTFTCCYRIPSSLDEQSISAPIGGPVSNTYVRVLDEALDLVPPGVPGELFIGGDGLARGYVGRPDLTAECFVPDPRATTPGARLYRTGDVVSYLPDGSLRFIGRLDDQVKIRGFRIEPGEIASVLSSHPEVRDAAVVVDRDPRGDKALVAYYIARSSADLDESRKELLAHLSERLPEHMVPAYFVRLESLPLTENGKLDRRALPSPWETSGASEASSQRLGAGTLEPASSALEATIASLWREVLKLERVGVLDNFFEIGGHSLLLLNLRKRLKEELGERAPSTVDLFRYPTVRALASHISGRAAPAADASPRMAGGPSSGREPIAIVGMAGRFPGAENLEMFWENVREGRESITFFNEEELLLEGLDPVECRNPRYIKARGIVDHAEFFDAAFFGYTPREAEILDPQQRVFLETAWEALESAGYGGDGHRGRIGVFAGATTNAYAARILAHPETARAVGQYAAFLNTDKDFLSTRVSYKLNLTGPSVTVQTACSTSLVAVHLACQSLRAGECEIALAGGVSIGVPRKRGYLHADGGILSSDGHCRPFDALASGTVAGEGSGVLVLRRLTDAVQSEDSVHAVILGSAINNDGSTKVGYTAPSVRGQAAVVSEALGTAEAAPSSIAYVEAHGTGTSLGDPIELEALKEVFGTDEEKRCGIGSLKSNIGHLDAAAGVAGVIKTVLALENESLPPSLHYETPNPKLGIEASPFYVVDRLRDWKRASGAPPRRAGVSSFGIGGANAHVVLEEAPERTPSQPSTRRHQLLLLSARSDSGLESTRAALRRHLEAHPDLDPADVAFTLAVGRRRFDHRAVAICSGSGTGPGPGGPRAAAELLDASAEVVTAHEAEGDRAVTFVFPGQGTQYVNMGRAIYTSEPLFREAMDEGFELLRRELGRDVRAILYPEEGGEDAARRALAETEVTQPVLFLVQVATSRLLASWGLVPEALIGHSIGEYAAACVAGVFDFETGLELAALRGRVMQQAARGAMTSVALSESRILSRLRAGGGVGVAAVNGDALTVVSGTIAGIESLERELDAEGVPYKRLDTSHAFHSDLMESAADELRRALARFELREPTIPFVSNVTGTWILPRDARDPAYWARHLRQPVRFASGVSTILEGSTRAVIELGRSGLPGELRAKAPVVVSTLGGRGRHRHVSEDRALAEAVGRLWLSGVRLDWEGYYGRERRRRVGLPTYPFERERFWLDRSPALAGSRPARLARADERDPIADWLYAPQWRSTRAVEEAPVPHGEKWLVLEGEDGHGRRLAGALLEALERRGARVVRARVAERFGRLEENLYGLRPDALEDYASLATELDRAGARPDHIAHFWSIPVDDGAASGPSDALARFERQTRRGFASLVRLVQSLTDRGRSLEQPFTLTVVTANLHDVHGEEPLAPDSAPVMGIVKVLPQEHPGIRARNVDVTLPQGEAVDDPAALRRLALELASPGREPVVALRGRKRFVPELERVERSDSGSKGTTLLRSGGVYWITGGLGRLGVALAEHLARRHDARVVLLGRSPVPPKETWVDAGGALARIHDLEREVQRESAGVSAAIEVVSADMSDRARLGEVLDDTLARFGRLDGVIHAAGTTSGPAFRPVDELEPMHWDTFFDAKARGLFALEEVLRARSSEHDCRFVLLMSSIATLLGGLDFAAYAAANTFMNHFALARERASSPGPTWMSASWDGFRFDGGEGSVENRRALGRTVKDFALTADEGVEIFERLLGMASAPSVVVATSDPSARLAVWTTARAKGSGGAPTATTASSPSRSRPDVRSAFAPPRTELERSVVAIWEDVLGVEGVGLDDDFFELGGHSLSALQIVSAVSERFGIEVPIRRLFEAPTAAAIASLLQPSLEGAASSSSGGRGSAPPSIEDLLGSVEAMSEEEARELLAQSSRREPESDHDE